MSARTRPRYRAGSAAGEVSDILGAEFPAFPFDDASFDFIASDTAIHHMNFEAALMAMSRLLRPGGQLAIVGLARNAAMADWRPAPPRGPAPRAESLAAFPQYVRKGRHES